MVAFIVSGETIVALRVLQQNSRAAKHDMFLANKKRPSRRSFFIGGARSLTAKLIC